MSKKSQKTRLHRYAGMHQSAKHCGQVELLAPAGVSAKAHKNGLSIKNAKILKKAANKIELLAPAGSPEKLKYAIEWGADAVYAGVPHVSMRARVNSFTEKSLAEAAEYIHDHGKKLFVTLNIYAHNYHLPVVEKHLKFLKKINVDAVIVADPGIMALVRKFLPGTDIHLSTQANVTNWQAAKFWYDLGINRVVLAREVTLEDIIQIKKHVPKLELEYFVHGAMCMSYSGRCILSKWMSGKSANLGDCTQPCRWAYKLVTSDQLQVTKKAKTDENKSLVTNSHSSLKQFKTMEVKEVQSGRPVVLEEDSHGTYFFNSKDLNLLEHLLELKKAGVNSFKIEGRNKSVSYVANVVRAYRSVLDAIEGDKSLAEIKKIQKWSTGELDKLANRGYTKGFLLGKEPEHSFDGQQSNEQFQFVGEILESDGNKLKVKVHNAIRQNETFEVVTKEKNIPVKIQAIYNHEMNEVGSAHGGHGNLYYILVNKKGIGPMSLIRKINK